MKTITLDELFTISKNLNSLKNYEVQGVYGSDDFFAIKLWNQKISWISVSLKGATPFIFGPGEIKKLNKRLTKPVFTFFNKYFKQAIFESSSVKAEFGRVLELNFKSPTGENLKIEVRLFRGGVNFGAFANSKAVYLHKPDDLEVLSNESAISREPRNIDHIQKEIFELINKKGKDLLENDKDKALDKSKIAQDKIRSAIAFQKKDPYLMIAKKLESGEKRSDLDKELKRLLVDKKNDQENILYCYEQHKLRDQRIDRLKRRLDELESGVLSVQKNDAVKNYKPEVKGIPRFNIAEGITAFCGRKAKENLLLIRKAKAWYLWMHLKDYPSAHVIVEKNKNKELTEGELRKAANFLFFRGAPKKLIGAPEVSFEIIFTEIRHVRPIKGDKLGRVTAQNVKSRVYLWKSSDKFSI